MTPAEDAVDRARYNGTLQLLAWQIQKVYRAAGQWLDDPDALQLATAKITGRIKLPPNLKPDHVQRCPRCGRAHIVPLTRAEQAGLRDAVDRLCTLARAVVNQDHVAQQALPLGDTINDSKLIRIADVKLGHEATTGGGQRLPSGIGSDDERGAGHQGTGIGPGKTIRRQPYGNREETAILRDIAAELRDQLARQADETVLTKRKMAWMTTDHGSATDRQRDAQYLTHVIGLSQREAAGRMKVSLASLQSLLKKYDKNSG